MQITFHASDKLPDDVAAALVPGDQGTSLLLNEDATAEELAEALTAIVRQWASAEWMYIGSVDRHLRAIS